MREVLDALQRWYGDGVPVGLATVIEVRKSSPRQPGASMAVTPDGRVAGSVSGGCVEGAVFEECQGVLAGRTPKRLSYGISDDDAFQVGLICGGEIDLFVEVLDRAAMPWFAEVAAAIEAEEPVATATVVDAGQTGVPLGARLAVWPGRVEGSLGAAGLDAAVAEDTRGLLEAGQTAQRRYGADGERRPDGLAVFIQSFAPRPRLLVFGAIDFAAATARIGAFLGYRVTVC
ncbi:MAG: XdhC family protein, partial [Geminicoccales bacterium]